MISVPQRTIRRPVTCSGIGIHSGDPATVVCQPAPLGTGIVFVRVDRPASPAVKAAASMVSDTQRGIPLGQRTPVRTVEHLPAAGAGGLGTQVVDVDPSRHQFVDEIAPSRTWGFADELQTLQRAGLARGASASNALGIGAEGYLSPPRFPDEPARHKVLDLLGDLMLAETVVHAHIIACGAGHDLHVELARRIVETVQR